MKAVVGKRVVVTWLIRLEITGMRKCLKSTLILSGDFEAIK